MLSCLLPLSVVKVYFLLFNTSLLFSFYLFPFFFLLLLFCFSLDGTSPARFFVESGMEVLYPANVYNLETDKPFFCIAVLAPIDVRYDLFILFFQWIIRYCVFFVLVLTFVATHFVCLFPLSSSPYSTHTYTYTHTSLKCVLHYVLLVRVVCFRFLCQQQECSLIAPTYRPCPVPLDPGSKSSR